MEYDKHSLTRSTPPTTTPPPPHTHTLQPTTMTGTPKFFVSKPSESGSNNCSSIGPFFFVVVVVAAVVVAVAAVAQQIVQLNWEHQSH